MSRVSRCIDNDPMELFQGIIKDEIKILYSYKTVDEFKDAQQSYLNSYVNFRSQKRFKGKTPALVREETMLSSHPERYSRLVNYEVRKY